MKISKRFLLLAVVASLFLNVIVVASTPQATVNTDLLRNGDFEEGFRPIPGCGMVAVGWGCFTNGGAAHYGFYDDQWSPVVFSGQHSQLIEINTKGLAYGDPDRFAGIYQTVTVLPGHKYTLDLHGIIRADDNDPDAWRYRVQVGYLESDESDWTKVTNWAEMPWDTYYPRTSPGGFSDGTLEITPGSSKLTIFIRVWKKWGVPYRELDVNLDAVSLMGPKVVCNPTTPAQPCETPKPTEKPTAAPTPPELTCDGSNLLKNGDFESGFEASAVAKEWHSFTNGGAAGFGFYDETWKPAVFQGDHAQMIEINSKGIASPDPDRYAGIYQVVDGLTPGQTYQIDLHGMIRELDHETHAGEDPYRFVAQWGVAADGETDWTKVSDWYTIRLPMGDRLSPPGYGEYIARFKAPSKKVTLFLRGWKKWATPYREFDLDFDQVSLLACHPKAKGGTYVVKPGDTLSSIAAMFGVSVQDLIAANGITDPDLILVGQELTIPGAGSPTPAPTTPVPTSTPTSTPPPATPTPETSGGAAPTPTAGAVRYHIVRPGETLTGIATLYGVSLEDLIAANKAADPSFDPDLIYVGQKIIVPSS
jgi:LysM repeat protein